MRTRLYLDIDGVINQIHNGPEPEPVYIAGYPIRAYPSTVRAFMALFDEVVWATSWVLHQEPLEEMESFLGVDRLEVIDTTMYELQNGMMLGDTGKGAAVARHFDADPLEPKMALWVDDMLGDEDFKIARERKIVTFRPDEKHGAYQFFNACIDTGLSWSRLVREDRLA